MSILTFRFRSRVKDAEIIITIKVYTSLPENRFHQKGFNEKFSWNINIVEIDRVPRLPPAKSTLQLQKAESYSTVGLHVEHPDTYCTDVWPGQPCLQIIFTHETQGNGNMHKISNLVELQSLKRGGRWCKLKMIITAIKRDISESEKRKMPFIDIQYLKVDSEYEGGKEKRMQELKSKDYVGWWINPQPIFVEM